MAKDQQGREVPVTKYNADGSELKIKSKWWDQKEADMHAHVFAVVSQIKEWQNYRSLQNLRYARLYSNMDMIGLHAGGFARINDPAAFLTNMISYNVIKSCIDTAASKLGAKRPRPLFLTDDGDWSLQRRAELLTSFFEGLFDTMGTGLGDARTLYGIGRRGFVDAGIFGTGATKLYTDKEERTVKAERILIEEIIVDDTEGMYEQPRQLHQEKMAFREVLCDLFPKKADKIILAKSMLGQYESQSAADMIRVVESWHIPSGGNASDGRRCISVDGCTIEVDDWKKDYFPFLFQRWNPRILGFYGQGLAEELLPIQLEINKMLRTIAIAQHLMCTPQVWLEVQNQQVVNHIDNEIGGIRYYTGQPPVFTTPSAMPGEFYQHLENLYKKAFEITGTSQMSATSTKPKGLDSKVALREWQDIESDRFQNVGLRYQDWYMDATYMAMDMMEDLSKDGGKDPKVRVGSMDASREIGWKEVRIAKEKLKLRAFPTDILPSQPAAKLEKVQELTQAGYFDREESLELLEFPDIRSVTSYKTAGRQVVRKVLEFIVEKAEYMPPEPYMPLQLARNLSQAYYNKGKLGNMPEDRLELLQRFMDDTQALIEQQKAAESGASPGPAPGGEPTPPPGGGVPTDQAAVTAMAGGAAPMAQPMTQPTSDLLPVAGNA